MPRSRAKKRVFFIGALLIALAYALAIFADFFAPYDHREQVRGAPAAPISTISFTGADESFSFRPRVFAYRLVDPIAQRYETDETKSAPIGLFTRGYTYRLLGLFETNIHLFGTLDADPISPRINLLGTDQLGRDRFSRLVRAMRFSLLVAPLGTLLACAIGIAIGLISGYANRSIDTVLMGVTDTMLSLPSLILILAARVAFPLELPPMTAASLLICIFALVGWAEMARLTRGLVRSTREMDYILAAKATGVTPFRTLMRHILPNISSPLITQAMLILPAFLLSEAALSFLGVGLQEPEPSLGNMLSAAADIGQLREHTFLLLSPAIVIFVFVLAVRLCGEGRRTR